MDFMQGTCGACAGLCSGPCMQRGVAAHGEMPCSHPNLAKSSMIILSVSTVGTKTMNWIPRTHILRPESSGWPQHQTLAVKTPADCSLICVSSESSFQERQACLPLPRSAGTCHRY